MSYKKIKRNPKEMSPVSPVMFHLLLSLGDRKLPGRGLKKAIEKQTGGEMRLGPSTLYGTLRRMVIAGLVEEFDQSLDQFHDKRRFFKITDFALRVLKAEEGRLREMLQYVSAAQIKKTLWQTWSVIETQDDYQFPEEVSILPTNPASSA